MATMSLLVVLCLMRSCARYDHCYIRIFYIEHLSLNVLLGFKVAKFKT